MIDSTKDRATHPGTPVLALCVALIGTACTSTHAQTDARGAAVRASACLGSTLGYGDAQLLLVFGRRGRTPTCAATADDCDEYLACVGLDPEAPCEFSREPRCDGDVVEYCDGRAGLVYRRDCAENPSNPVCAIDDAGIPDCTSGAECGDSGTSRCDGNVWVLCSGGLEHRTDCGDRTCVESGGEARCVDRVEECEVDRCDGRYIERCSAGVGVLVEDCADHYGSDTCLEVDGEARCGSSTSECTDGAVECHGTTARICVEDRWIEFPCGDFQGGRCVEEPDDRLRCVVDGA